MDARPSPTILDVTAYYKFDIQNLYCQKFTFKRQKLNTCISKLYKRHVNYINAASNDSKHCF